MSTDLVAHAIGLYVVRHSLRVCIRIEYFEGV